MELKEPDVPISEMTHGTAMTFSILTSAIRDGNALTKFTVSAIRTKKEKVLEAMPLANNTANHTHNQRNINAISPTTSASNVTKKILTHALKTEKKPAITVKPHHKLNSDATDPTKSTHHAKNATKVTKDVDNKNKYARTALHQPSS